VSEELQYGRDGFERVARGLMNAWCGMDLDEVFVVGGDTDTLVLAMRIDYFPGQLAMRAQGGRVYGHGHSRGDHVSRQERKITEWLDAPLIPVRPGATAAGSQSRGAAPPITPPTACVSA
jgi:hypothetical protein